MPNRAIITTAVGAKALAMQAQHWSPSLAKCIGRDVEVITVRDCPEPIVVGRLASQARAIKVAGLGLDQVAIFDCTDLLFQKDLGGLWTLAAGRVILAPEGHPKSLADHKLARYWLRQADDAATRIVMERSDRMLLNGGMIAGPAEMVADLLSRAVTLAEMLLTHGVKAADEIALSVLAPELDHDTLSHAAYYNRTLYGMTRRAITRGVITGEWLVNGVAPAVMHDNGRGNRPLLWS